MRSKPRPNRRRVARRYGRSRRWCWWPGCDTRSRKPRRRACGCKCRRCKGHPPRNLGRDDRLPLLIERLGTSFAESIRPHLATGRLIPRKETQAILEWIASPGKERLLMLHGPAGAGKSGVLYELATELKARGIPLLP